MRDFNLDGESFEIDDELLISNIINNNSDKIYTNKNMLNPYDYDLNCFNKKTKEFIGYIEVERSTNYDFLGGNNWYHSFLMRKIFIWNENQYKDQILKDNADKTVYIKFNKNFGLEDCICCSIENITFFDSEIQQKTNDVRKDMVFRTNQNDKRVAKGINNCIKYIEEFFGV